ncbi:TfoX/Sxy family DNA transformation protein [Orbus wheelerorum]|uniref:TfoX/Sxy family DNA transformation protein n=1 Tax=Orbus wheelerorum TaxID=3074111 RepID=UPI00370D2CAE
MKEYKKSIINKLSSCFTQYEMKQISIKPLFGGAGVCLNEVMFAWIYDNNLYLRGHVDYLTRFIQLNMEPLIFGTGVTVKLLQYYKVTNYLWGDEKAFKDIVQMVIKYACLDKLSKRRIKESRIKDLPNMTLSLERSLFRVGIINLAAFRRQGSFKSYYKLEQCNKSLSKNILYTLHSALMGNHVATLTEEQKNTLKKEYNEFTISQ